MNIDIEELNAVFARKTVDYSIYNDIQKGTVKRTVLRRFVRVENTVRTEFDNGFHHYFNPDQMDDDAVSGPLSSYSSRRLEIVLVKP